MADATLVLKILDAQLAIKNANPSAHLMINLADLSSAGFSDEDIAKLEDAGVNVYSSVIEEDEG